MKTLLKFAFTILTALSASTVNAQTIKPIKTITKTTNTKVGAAAVASKQEKIWLEDITEWLCPQSVIRGDREFGGHGPRVKCEVKIRLSENGKEIWADIHLWAQETVHDWSTTEATWSKKVYDAPYGKTIHKIISGNGFTNRIHQSTGRIPTFVPGSDVQAGLNNFLDGQAISRDVLKAHGVPKEFFDVHGAPLHLSQDIIKDLISSYVRGNTVMKVAPIEGTLVNFFHIVGDTGGDDISNDDNCNDDTRIERIEFFAVYVEFK